MSAGLLTAVAFLGALVGLAAPRLARRFVPADPACRPTTASAEAPGVTATPVAVVLATTASATATPAGPVSLTAASVAGSPARPALVSPAVGAALVGGAVFGGLAAGRGTDPVLPVLLALAVLGLVLAHVDLACLRLPDPLVGAAALVTGGGLAAAAVLAGTPQRLLAALAGAAVAGGAHVALALLPRSRLGFGDVKLAAVLGLPLGWLGWSSLSYGLLLPHLLNGLVVLVLLAARKVGPHTALPFGPALLTGAWLATLLP